MNPTEDNEQVAVFAWADWNQDRWPELALLFHIPNGGYRHPATAARMKELGVKPGVPDLFLPAARGNYHGLWIEMKRKKGGKVSPMQTAWLESLTAQGYKTAVCHGAAEAIVMIACYLEDTE